MQDCPISTLMIMSLWIIVTQVDSEMCMNGDFCSAPKSCCTSSGRCCSWKDKHDEKTINYPYGGYYRLKIWDMWYFWILVILVIISCFGGCGYWWRRQIMIYTRTTSFHHNFNNNRHHLHRHHNNFRYYHRPQWSRTSNSSETSVGDEQSNTGSTPGHSPYMTCALYYDDDHALTNHNELIIRPPLYSEVTAKPELYPVVEESLQESLKITPPSDFRCADLDCSASGLVCTTSPSNSTYSTNRSSVFPPPPYFGESDVGGAPSCPTSNLSTPGSVMSYSINSDVSSFLNNRVDSSSLPNSSVVHSRTSCLSPPLATSPTSGEIPSSRGDGDQSRGSSSSSSSPLSTPSEALNRIEQSVSAIIRLGTEERDGDDGYFAPLVPIDRSQDATCDLRLANNRQIRLKSTSNVRNNRTRRNSIGCAVRVDTMVDVEEVRNRGRRGLLVRARSDESDNVDETTILIRSIN